jgi:hypothetical protein
MWCPHITQKSNCKKIILVTIIFGGFSVFMPSTQCNHIMWLNFFFEHTNFEKLFSFIVI